MVRAAVVPMLYGDNLRDAMEFYKNAFGATERWSISNNNGGVHVAEIEIQSNLVRLHEEVARDKSISPSTAKGTTVVLGLLVENPDELFDKAIAKGAKALSAMKDFEYGYRQGTLVDPFGHHWCLERLDDINKKPIFP